MGPARRRRVPSAAADALADLLEGDEDICTCGIVVAEVFQGLRRDRERGALQRSFEDLLLLKAERWPAAPLKGED